eukprot:1432072-Pleurochrysis_carterae.AAC.1
MQIRYAQHDSLVLVTHDDVFNELFSHNLNATAKAKNSSLADELATGSVPHCAVVWCCCDFSRLGELADSRESAAKASNLRAWLQSCNSM